MLLDLATEIQAQGLGTLSVDTFVAHLPLAPVRAMALFEEEAGVPTTTASGIVQWEQPDVLIVFRDETYAAARLWAEQVYQRLLRVVNREVGSARTFYLTAGVRTTPYYDGIDGVGHPVIAFACAPQKALNVEVP